MHSNQHPTSRHTLFKRTNTVLSDSAFSSLTPAPYQQTHTLKRTNTVLSDLPFNRTQTSILPAVSDKTCQPHCSSVLQEVQTTLLFKRSFTQPVQCLSTHPSIALKPAPYLLQRTPKAANHTLQAFLHPTSSVLINSPFNRTQTSTLPAGSDKNCQPHSSSVLQRAK